VRAQRQPEEGQQRREEKGEKRKKRAGERRMVMKQSPQLYLRV
jgi:hypothetical protein